MMATSVEKPVMNNERIEQPEIVAARRAVRDRYGALPVPDSSYLVLMSPRSGSNLLCVHLEKIGYGRPVEGFHFSQSWLRREYGFSGDLEDPFSHMLQVLQYGTVNGIFGLKLSWVEFEIFLAKARQLIGPVGVNLSAAQVVEVFFPQPKYIHLQRRDKVKQAVSYARAMQTGIWMVETGQSDAFRDYILPAAYDREHIESLLDNLLAFDLAWEQYLCKSEITAFTFWYEDLAKDYVNKMLDVYHFLGISRQQVIEPPLRQQADQVLQEWVVRFTSETDWLHEEHTERALKEGDFLAVYLARTMILVRQRERERWSKLPANRFRNVRKLMHRIGNKLSSSGRA